MNQDLKKEKSAKEAFKLIEPKLKKDTIIGIGTGSTTNFFIEELNKARNNIKGVVCSSNASEELIDKLADIGYDPQFGARPIKRVMQKEVVNELSKQLLAGKVSVGEELVLDEFDGKYVFRKPIEQDVVS